MTNKQVNAAGMWSFNFNRVRGSSGKSSFLSRQSEVGRVNFGSDEEIDVKTIRGLRKMNSPYLPGFSMPVPTQHQKHLSGCE